MGFSCRRIRCLKNSCVQQLVILIWLYIMNLGNNSSVDAFAAVKVYRNLFCSSNLLSASSFHWFCSLDSFFIKKTRFSLQIMKKFQNSKFSFFKFGCFMIL